jgi:transcriptional regulator with XRE-family HTH domain
MRDAELYRDWGRRVRSRRKALGLSQAELATRAGSSSAHVSNIEVGRTSVSDEVRVALAGALGVRPVELFPYPEDLTPAGAAVEAS